MLFFLMLCYLLILSMFVLFSLFISHQFHCRLLDVDNERVLSRFSFYFGEDQTLCIGHFIICKLADSNGSKVDLKLQVMKLLVIVLYSNEVVDGLNVGYDYITCMYPVISCCADN